LEEFVEVLFEQKHLLTNKILNNKSLFRSLRRVNKFQMWAHLTK